MNKIGQVWIETVLYTLIGLALIGLVLAFVAPRIGEAKDRLLVDQTINSLSEIDGKINEVLDGAVGNTRKVVITMKKGELYFDTENDKITFILPDIGKPYSEPGIDVFVQRIKVHTYKQQKGYGVNLTLDYMDRINITYSNIEKNTPDKLSAAPLSYTIYVESKPGDTVNIAPSF